MHQPARLPVVAATLIAACVGLASAGCHRSPDRATAAVAPGASVVLVSIDTLRADRLPAYGHAAGETPALDAFRRESLLHEAMYTHCPLTLPAHASMLTGLLPAQHGVRDNVGYRFDAAAHPTVPALLAARGYATAAAVSAYVLRGATGLRAAFDFYDEPAGGPTGAGLGEGQRPGGETVRRALAWLDGVGRRPFFLFVHLYEPHSPYEPPEPLRARWGSTYDGEVAAADAAVGALLDGLRARGRYHEAMVIVTSDHGEGLGDHGEEEHGILLYREVLRVPLLLKLPGGSRAGHTLEHAGGLRDLAPTILGALGVPAPPAAAGRNLLDDRPDRAGISSETYYPRLHLGWSELRSLVDDRYHYVAGPRPELYDLVRDPGELSDLATAEPKVARAMGDALAAQQTAFAEPAPATAEERERLAALGYLGGPATPPAASGAARPNPRDHIHVRTEIKAGMDLVRQGRDREAVAAMRRLLADRPGLFDVQVELAAALDRLGREREALEAYAQAASISPEMAPALALSTGRLRLEHGRIAEAESDARKALSAEPAAARELLARAALARGDLERATEEAKAAAGDPAAEEGAAVVLAAVAARRGDLSAAVALAEDTARRNRDRGGRPVPSLQLVRGDALARLGRHEEAEGALRAELLSFPRNARAWASLAVVSAVRGRPIAESRALLERMHEARPGPESALLAARTLDFIGDAQEAERWRRRARGGPSAGGSTSPAGLEAGR